MKYAISRQYGKDTIIVNEGIYSNREDAEKRCIELANEKKATIANAYKIPLEDVRVVKSYDGIIWIKWLNYSNMYEVVELEEN